MSRGKELPMGVVPAPAPTKVRRPRSGSVVLMAGLAVVLAVGVISMVIADQRKGDPAMGTQGGPGTPAAGPVKPPPSRPLVSHAVTYELTGDGALNITYVTRGSDIAQVSEATDLWSVSLEDQTAPDVQRYYSLMAQDA